MRTEIATIDTEEVRKIAVEVSPLVEKAKAFVVTDIITCQAGEHISHECAMREKRIDAEFDDQIGQANKLHKSLLAQKAKYKNPNTEAKQILDKKTRTWRQEEQKRQSIENENRRKEEQEKRDAEKLALAEKAEKAGMGDLADRIIEEPDNLPEIMPVELPKAEGSSTRERWIGEVVDPKLIPAEYMIPSTPDLTALGAITRALKGNTKIPGWRVWNEGSTVHKKI